MNERVDVENIIEVSNTKHTKRGKKNGEGSDEEEDPNEQSPKNEQEKKYHESVISDIYGDISSSDEDEEDEETQEKKILEESKKKEEELKRQNSKKSAIPEKVMETVNNMFEQAKTRYQEQQQLVKVERAVSGVFSNAFTKVFSFANLNSSMTSSKRTRYLFHRQICLKSKKSRSHHSTTI